MSDFTPFFKTLTDNPEVVRLLDVSVGSVLTRNGWSTSRAPADIQDVAQHISDWITAALRNRASWLEKVNDKNVPLKLAKCHTLEMLTHEADKAMRMALQKCEFAMPIAGEDEVVAHLDEGYTLVRLLTEASLRREGFMMQHCIGLGAYDSALTTPGVEFLSLRDRMGKAHATLEVIDGLVMQLKGKQNRLPLPPYLNLLAPVLRSRGLRVKPKQIIDGLVEAEDGQLHSVYNLPQNFSATNVCAYHLSDLTELPHGMRAVGYISLEGSGLRLVPDNLQSGSELYIVRSKELVKIGDGVRIGDNLHLGGCRMLTALPADLHIEGNLYTRWIDFYGDPPKEDEFCDRLVDLPSSLYVGGDVYLDGCRSLKTFPRGLVVRKSLNIQGTQIESLPDQMIIPENLFIGGGFLQAFPKVLHIGKDLRVDLHGFGLLLNAIEARHDITIGGSVYVEGQPISINLKKPPEDDPQYMEWTECGRYYSYNPPPDIPPPLTDWTRVPA